MNPLDPLLTLTSMLREEHIYFTMGSFRDSVMLIVPTPSQYLEIEFFADGRIEVQNFGPASEVREMPLSQIIEMVISETNGQTKG